MNRKRLLMIGLLALGLAFLLTASMFKVARTGKTATAGPVMSPVVVAERDLPLGKEIQAADVRVTQLPTEDLPVGVFHNTQEVIGRGVIVDMMKNEPVMATKVADPNAGAGLPPRIPHGMRAVSVKVNEVVAVAGFIRPNSRVDVLLTGNISKENDPTKFQTTTVLQNVTVLTVAQEMQDRADGKPMPDASVVTLLVTPDDAQKLTLASTQGRIQLALRNPLDLEQTTTPTLLNATLYGAPAAPPVVVRGVKKTIVPPPPSTYTVELIRGDKRDTTKF
ncbi:MAG: Flp pilus assembly protein CpaB [Acidobacteria bacterium]|nr:Flp pilus assembly protein CpaB [Acidobacteriaceae bacterium]MBV9609440.1 Flp pilus assembly protein CpaB [Acidobacteriota bacterium]